MNIIPEMTDPLGKYWEQPKDIREAEMDDTHVLLTQAQFDGLHDYSASLPTGTYDGKCWRAFGGRKDPNWHLGWFHPCDIVGQIGIGWRRIPVV